MTPDDSGNLLKLLKQHLGWYPLMEPVDIYKLLYQGVMGSEHLMAAPEEFKLQLELEMNGLKGDPTERWLEPVNADETILRLNLRACKDRQLNLDLLIPALLRTGDMCIGSQTILQKTWVKFIELCETGQINQFSTDTVYGFGGWLVEMAFPPVHHSDSYRRAYQPAYRLISVKFISEIGLANDAG
jgi:hypothetical protein